MRRPRNHLPEADAIALLSDLRVHQLATTAPDGSPVLRTLNGVVLGRAIYFHGAPKGEKALSLGRPAVVAAHRSIAEIPSHWIDPERACPASSWYRSVQIKGPLLAVEDLNEKAAALQALMERSQPEGRFRPITARDPLYAKVLEGLLVMKVPFEVVSGKLLAGQGAPSRIPGVLRGLWSRARPRDMAAFETVRALHPQARLPDAFEAPDGYRLHCCLDEPREAAVLLDGQYWTAEWTLEQLVEKVRNARAWAGARDATGRLVATASAIGDGGRGWLMDVVVQPDHRGRGLGHAICRLLLDHRLLRGARVGLRTRDAQDVYARLGFEVAGGGPTFMWRRPTGLGSADE